MPVSRSTGQGVLLVQYTLWAMKRGGGHFPKNTPFYNLLCLNKEKTGASRGTTGEQSQTAAGDLALSVGVRLDNPNPCTKAQHKPCRHFSFCVVLTAPEPLSAGRARAENRAEDWAYPVRLPQVLALHTANPGREMAQQRFIFIHNYRKSRHLLPKSPPFVAEV